MNTVLSVPVDRFQQGVLLGCQVTRFVAGVIEL